MRLRVLPVLLLCATAPVTAGAQTGPIAYIQATITETNAAAGSLASMTASGGTRVARVRGSAASSLRNLRPGDEAILTVEGPADRPVVTSVKISRVVPAAPPPETVGGPYAWTQTVPSRPSWPNPYSRINPGLPSRPARPRAGGAVTVMPAALGGPAPARPVAAPAVLSGAPTVPAIAAPAPPAPPARDETSTVDGLRARGAREFDAAVSRLAAEARAVDAAYSRYKASCPSTLAAGDASRDWFGVWDGVAVSDGGPACASLLDEVMRLAAPVKTGMLAAHEAARRAWVLPGTMTDIRRRHAMEWSGWDH